MIGWLEHLRQFARAGGARGPKRSAGCGCLLLDVTHAAGGASGPPQPEAFNERLAALGVTEEHPRPGRPRSYIRLSEPGGENPDTFRELWAEEF